MNREMTDEKRRRSLCHALLIADCNYYINGKPVTKRAADEIKRLAALLKDYKLTFGDIHDVNWNRDTSAGSEKDAAALAQSDAEPVAWKPNANMHAELDRSEMVARAMLKEIMKQIDYIETEGHIEWHKRIHVNGELYLPDISAAVLGYLYTAPPRPDRSAGLIEAAEITREWAGATSSLVEAHLLDALAREIRARAADRSGK